MSGRLLLAAAAAAMLLSCFSERAEPTALGAVDCSLPLDSSTIGRLGVVVIRDFAFHPAELRVSPGTRVTWINCETEGNARTPHTSTANAGAWSSPLLSFEQAYSTVLETAGTFEYHCEPHPVMTARVIVE